MEDKKQVSPAELAKGKIPERLKKQVDGYQTVLSKLMHAKATRGGTMDMLQSGPPEISVPQAALAINRNAEELMKKKGLRLTNEVKLAGATFLVSDLVELGNVGGVWEEPVDEGEKNAIFQDTLQDYIHEGLKSGEIDPIQLQKDTEPLLNEEQKKLGLQVAEKEGVPKDVNQNQIIAQAQGVMNRGQSKPKMGQMPQRRRA